MSAPERVSTPAGVGARTANQRFRDRWGRQLGWSTAFAAAAHVAVFAAAARVVLSYPSVDSEAMAASGDLMVVPYDDGFGSGAEGLAPAPAPAPVGGSVDVTSPEADPAATLGGGGSEPDDDAIRQALTSRLGRRGGSFFGRVAEPKVSPEPDGSATAEGVKPESEAQPAIDPGAETADLAELPEPDTLSLDRLSDIQPQLALVSASAWVLIRNQPEVEAYLRRGYRNGSLDPSEVGSVSVTLWIDQKGSVEWAEVSKSSGHPNLDEYALALFNEVADFRAAREQGVSVSRSVTFSLNFPW